MYIYICIFPIFWGHVYKLPIFLQLGRIFSRILLPSKWCPFPDPWGGTWRSCEVVPMWPQPFNACWRWEVRCATSHGRNSRSSGEFWGGFFLEAKKWQMTYFFCESKRGCWVGGLKKKWGEYAKIIHLFYFGIFCGPPMGLQKKIQGLESKLKKSVNSFSLH